MTGLALALALTAGQLQADEPRILYSGARLAAEVQLQRTVQQGNRRAIQRIPRAAKIAMVVGGAVSVAAVVAIWWLVPGIRRYRYDPNDPFGRGELDP